MKSTNFIKTKAAYAVAFVGIMTATIECGKIALAFLPNIEIVSLMIALYGYLFGWYGVASAALFVCIEPLVWGFGSWIVSYAIYWPLLAFLFMILARIKLENRFLITFAAFGMTFFFGILSSFVDVAFLLGINSKFHINFLLYYLRGIVFYIIHLLCNVITFFLLFPYLSKKLQKFEFLHQFSTKCK